MHLQSMRKKMHQVSSGNCQNERRKKRKRQRKKEKWTKKMLTKMEVLLSSCTLMLRRPASLEAFQIQRLWWDVGGSRNWRRNYNSSMDKMVKVCSYFVIPVVVLSKLLLKFEWSSLSCLWQEMSLVEKDCTSCSLFMFAGDNIYAVVIKFFHRFCKALPWNGLARHLFIETNPYCEQTWP